MEGENRYFLVFKAVRCHLPALSEKNEPVGSIPAFDDIEPVVNFLAKPLRRQVAAKKYCPLHLSKFQERLIRWVFQIGTGVFDSQRSEHKRVLNLFQRKGKQNDHDSLADPFFFLGGPFLTLFGIPK